MIVDLKRYRFSKSLPLKFFSAISFRVLSEICRVVSKISLKGLFRGTFFVRKTFVVKNLLILGAVNPLLKVRIDCFAPRANV